MSERYGASRIKRGLFHFILGKGISAVGGFLAMMLVVRGLPMEQFAGYSVLIALVEMFTALSGLGLAHVMLRYVPELYSLHFNHALRQLVFGALGLRTLILILVGIAAAFWSGGLSTLIGVDHVVGALQAFIWVAILRSTSNFLSQILESTLSQGIAQSAFSIGTISKFIGMAWLFYHHDMQLVDVIWVEAACDGLTALIMFLGVIRVVSDKQTAPAGEDRQWLSKRLRTIAHFAASGYMQHLAILPFGGNANRLVGGHMLTASGMAAFGFAQSLYEYFKRYLPAQLLVGLMRPIVVARYALRRDFSEAARMCNQVVQINVLLIFIAVVGLLISGNELLFAISSGKYSNTATLTLIGLCLVLLLETERAQLEVLVQTVERYRFLIGSNAIIASSILIAVLLLPYLGAVSFPLANSLGLTIANNRVKQLLSREGHHYRNDWFSTLLVLAIATVSVALGWMIKLTGSPWYLALLAGSAAYTLLGWLLCRDQVFSFVRELTSSTKNRLPEWKASSSNVQAEVKIVFGVLSSRQSAAAISDIARRVAPHRVIVHHDFSKQPDFSPDAPNVTVLPDPVKTAWGDWSLVAATLKLMQAALEDKTMTHFQLLSEACLPVRPIHDYVTTLQDVRPDILIDYLPLERREVILSHAWRYMFDNSYLSRLAQRATATLSRFHKQHLQIANINTSELRSATLGNGGFTLAICRSFLCNFSRLMNRKLRNMGISKPAIGSQWFGCSREMAQWILQARTHCQEFTQYAQRCHIPDEFFIHSLLASLAQSTNAVKILPAAHVLFWDGAKTGPDEITLQDLTRIRQSRRYFARKFPTNTEAEIRHAIALASESAFPFSNTTPTGEKP